MKNESMIDPSPFVPDDVIGYYHDRSVWNDEAQEGRPRALSNNKTLENLYRVQKLYYNVYNSVLNKIKEKYIHDENKLNEIKNKILDRIDNKIRTNTQGEMFIQIGKYYYTGSAKEHEKFFQSTKRNFNSILKEIGKEILDTLNNKVFDEEGKSIKLDSSL